MDVCLVVDGNAGRYKDLYWFGSFGSIIVYFQFVLLVYLAVVCSRGYKQARLFVARWIALVWLWQLPARNT